MPSLSTQLASRILERIKILDSPNGGHLSEQHLADALRVSRTPIRQALQLLEQMELVERRPNRGFFLMKAAKDLGVNPLLVHGDVEDPLYFQIAEDRLSGNLAPSFTEAELMRRYGVTRARILRLLEAMSREGWLSRLPGHGWEFQPTLSSPHAYEQSFRFRKLIEPAALLEPGYHLEPQVIARCREEQQAMLDGGILRWPRTETFLIGASFHESLVAGGNNPLLLDAIRRVNRLRRLIEYRITANRGRMIQQCKEHLHLLDLIEAGRLKNASVFLLKHLEEARSQKLILAIGLEGPHSDN